MRFDLLQSTTGQQRFSESVFDQYSNGYRDPGKKSWETLQFWQNRRKS